MTLLSPSGPAQETGLTEFPLLDPPARPRRRRRAGGPVVTLLTSPGGALGSFIVLALVVVAIFPAEIAPYSFRAIDVAHRLQGPTGQHLLGTDALGRDLLSRVIFGTRVALEVSVPAVGIALFVGLILGMIGGYLGGLVDNVVVLLTDTFQSFPAVVLAIAMLTVLGPSLRNLIIVIAVTFCPNYARTSRALVLSVKQNQYILAERALGARRLRILLVHVLPNIAAPLFILLAMDTPSAIGVEALLSFLGLGQPPPNSSWGQILSDGFNSILTSPWPVIWPCLALAVATVGFLMFGEALRDVLDPRLRGVSRWRA